MKNGTGLWVTAMLLSGVAGLAHAQKTPAYTSREFREDDMRVAKSCTMAAAAAVIVLTDNPNSESKRQAALSEVFRSGQLPMSELLPHTAALSAVEVLVANAKQPFDPARDGDAYRTVAAAVCSRLIDTK